MAEKDIAEKILEDYPDVFADIVNGLLFNGKMVIRPEELEDCRGDGQGGDIGPVPASAGRRAGAGFPVYADVFPVEKQPGEHLQHGDGLLEKERE